MRTIIVATLSTILSIPMAVSPALAQAREWGASPWGWHYMWGTMGIGMMLFMLVFWVLVILGIVVLIRWAWTSMGEAAQKGESAETALDILGKRYARGEVDKEEFDARRLDLRT